MPCELRHAVCSLRATSIGFPRIRDSAAPTTACDSPAWGGRLRGGSFIIRAAVNPGIEEESIESLRREIQRMLSEPIPRLEFRSALNAAAGAYSIRIQIRSQQIERIVELILAGRGIDGYKYYSAGLKDVREDEFRAVAERILDMDKAVILELSGQTKR